MERYNEFTRAEYLEAMALVQPRAKAEALVAELFARSSTAIPEDLALDVGILVALRFVSAPCAARAVARLAHVPAAAKSSAERLRERMSLALGREPFL